MQIGMVDSLKELENNPEDNTIQCVRLPMRTFFTFFLLMFYFLIMTFTNLNILSIFVYCVYFINGIETIFKRYKYNEVSVFYYIVQKYAQ